MRPSVVVVFAVLLAIVSLSSGIVAASGSHETGVFPSRTFYLITTGGSPSAYAYSSSMVATRSGTWTMTLDILTGQNVVVTVYRVDAGNLVRLGSWKLKAPGQSSGPLELEQGQSYQVNFLGSGKRGTSVLHETFAIVNALPVACFSVSSPPLTAGVPVTFDASCSYDLDGAIVGYEWEFGDGQAGIGQTADHTFSQVGTYTAVLTVVDSDGGTEGSAMALQIEGPSSTHFSMPFYDSGWDADSDGLYDSLRLNLSLYVTAPGEYRVDAILYASYSIVSSRTFNLEIGIDFAQVLVSGVEIYLQQTNGPYSVSLTLSDSLGNYLDSAAYLTNAYLYTQFERPGAQISGPFSDSGVDSNADGLFDSLLVNIGLTADEPGSYFVRGNLLRADVSPPFSMNVSAAVDLEAGLQSVSLAFDGGPIFASGVDGPYTVSIGLWNGTETGGVFLGWESFQTGPYLHTNFNPPVAYLTPPHSDQGSDTDGDQLWNQLVILVHFNVTSTAFITLEASLYSSDLTVLLGTSTGGQTYVPGMYVEPRGFDGVAIRQSGLSGPYVANLRLSEWSGTVLSQAYYVTAAYSYLAFDAPSAALTGTFHDQGIDADGDGLFDWLEMDVQVSVVDAGIFQITGNLGPGALWTAMNFSGLGPGLHTVPLFFDGVAINASTVDGPYTVDMWLYDVYSGNGLGHADFVTSPYSHLQFENLPAILTGAPSDQGVDLDGNGLYDALAIDVPISVTTAAWYDLQLCIGSADGALNLCYQTSLFLSLGTHSVRFLIDGGSILASGADGPYYGGVWLYRDPRDAVTLGFATYQTAYYGHTEFEA